jgi:hypothetical protein
VCRALSDTSAPFCVKNLCIHHLHQLQEYQPQQVSGYFFASGVNMLLPFVPKNAAPAHASQTPFR